MRILLARTDRVGDLILSTPAIASVRRSFPEAHLTLACSRYNSVVVERSPDVDALALYSDEETPAAFGARFRGVDLAVALAPRDVDHRIVAATGAPKRVGYTYATRYLARLVLRLRLTDVVLSQADPRLAERYPERPIAHEVDQVLAVARAAGATELAHDLVLPLSAADRAAAAGLPERPIVVQLGRRWSEGGSTAASCLALFRELRALGRPLVATYGSDGEELADGGARGRGGRRRAGRPAVRGLGGDLRAGGLRGDHRHRRDPRRQRGAGTDGGHLRGQVVSAGLPRMVAVPRAERDPPQTAGRDRIIAARLARRDRRCRRLALVNYFGAVGPSHIVSYTRWWSPTAIAAAIIASQLPNVGASRVCLPGRRRTISRPKRNTVQDGVAHSVHQSWPPRWFTHKQS